MLILFFVFVFNIHFTKRPFIEDKQIICPQLAPSISILKSCRWHTFQKKTNIWFMWKDLSTVPPPMRTANGGGACQLLIDVNKVAHGRFILPPCRWSQRATSRHAVFRFVLALAEQKSQSVWSLPFIFTIAYFWREREREKKTYLLKKNNFNKKWQTEICMLCFQHHWT